MRLVRQFVAGCSYLGLLTFFLVAVSSRHPTWSDWAVTFLAVFLVAVSVTGLALVWLTRWAMRNDSRWGQFGLGSLLWTTLFVALFLATVRGLVLYWLPLGVRGTHVSDGQVFLGIAAVSLFLLAVSVPYLLMLTDSLLWLAVWLLRRPWRRRSRRAPFPPQTRNPDGHP